MVESRSAAPSQSPPLSGRRALVTGGGRGIGLAIARALTEAGAEVVVAGRTDRPLREAVAAGAAAHRVLVDLTDRAAHEAALDAVLDQGPVDIFIANAGAAESAPFARTTGDLFDRMIALNLTAVFDGIRRILPPMVARGSGRIVAIASTAGLTGYPYVSAYCAAKHGVVGLVRALAKETAKTGVTINAVCPGFTETDLVAGSVEAIVAKTGRTPDQARADLARSMPIGRLITPQEVAAAVLYLVSDTAGAVTGACLPVAGGEIA